MVLEENMYLGQVLFYTLDRLFLQYSHAISNAAIVCMPASSVVDQEVPPLPPLPRTCFGPFCIMMSNSAVEQAAHPPVLHCQPGTPNGPAVIGMWCRPTCSPAGGTLSTCHMRATAACPPSACAGA